MDFGENLKKIRTQRGLSQQDLANASDFSQVAVSKFESGKLNPEPKTIGKLAKALGVTTDRLIYGEENQDSGKAWLYPSRIR